MFQERWATPRRFVAGPLNLERHGPKREEILILDVEFLDKTLAPRSQLRVCLQILPYVLDGKQAGTP